RSGSSRSSSARTARADPGPWCRMPRTSITGSADIAARPVEVTPVRAVAHHGLQVLLPDHPVGDRVLDHRADDAAGDVGRAEHPVPEVGGEREPVGHHRDRLRGAERAARRFDPCPSAPGYSYAYCAGHRLTTADCSHYV